MLYAYVTNNLVMNNLSCPMCTFIYIIKSDLSSAHCVQFNNSQTSRYISRSNGFIDSGGNTKPICHKSAIAVYRRTYVNLEILGNCERKAWTERDLH